MEHREVLFLGHYFNRRHMNCFYEIKPHNKFLFLSFWGTKKLHDAIENFSKRLTVILKKDYYHGNLAQFIPCPRKIEAKMSLSSAQRRLCDVVIAIFIGYLAGEYEEERAKMAGTLLYAQSLTILVRLKQRSKRFGQYNLRLCRKYTWPTEGKHKISRRPSHYSCLMTDITTVNRMRYCSAAGG